MNEEQEMIQIETGERSESNEVSLSETHSDDSDWFQNKSKPKKQAIKSQRVLKQFKTRTEKSTFMKKSIQKKAKQMRFNPSGRETFG